MAAVAYSVKSSRVRSASAITFICTRCSIFSHTLPARDIPPNKRSPHIQLNAQTPMVPQKGFYQVYQRTRGVPILWKVCTERCIASILRLKWNCSGNQQIEWGWCKKRNIYSVEVWELGRNCNRLTKGKMFANSLCVVVMAAECFALQGCESCTQFITNWKQLVEFNWTALCWCWKSGLHYIAK